ncbi:MAG: RNase P subunit p30 family protein [Candidatus Hermodarchaeota archaeon]
MAKKQFYDFNLTISPNLSLYDDLAPFKETLRKLGYNGAVVEIPLDPIPNFKPLEYHSKDSFFFFRTTLQSSNIETLKTQLAKIRRKRHIIAALCTSVQITKWITLDHRVDALRFEGDNYKLFDLATARDAAATGKVLEIPMRQIIYIPSYKRIMIIRYISKAIQTAFVKKCPVIISSGATTPMELRSPRDLAALTNLFELDYFLAIDSISTIVQDLLERNHRKLSTEFIAPNIWHAKGENSG